MFSKILIANRGEIALRIIRAAAEMGIKTVAVYSEADKDALHTVMADEKVCIGPAKSSESYLNIPNIISTANITKSDAIHPGYGFLAENPRFPEVCGQEGITFIGPSSSVIRLMGDKNKARQEMKKAKLPVIPGSDQIIEDLEEAANQAKKIGYPVILKAAAGGGGKGMRIVKTESSLSDQFIIARNESHSAFGNPALYMEKYIQESRHIEIQVVRDHKGNSLALAERECSVQRKHQKVIEESPSPFIDDKLRKKMIKSVEAAADYLDYTSLGTFEFLVDKEKNFYFMEANTRIQVEHPITEFLYGIDLVKEQIKLAAGEPLSLNRNMDYRGHSVECRINAEDSQTFIPSPGKIDFLVFPGGQGIRVDSAAYQGWKIPPHYDSLLAKIIAHAPTREEALKKIETALEMTTVVGVKTNIPLHLKILGNSHFRHGDYHIQFLEKLLASGK
ncbi:MAG: acetyl-CoA carboxylase biotin carboxylase subunit [Candidatus Aminicenantes bacterium]